MGDEFAASSPFLFFTDHREELAPQVVAGRRAEFEGLWGAAASLVQIPDPQAEETFLRSHLDLSEREQPRGKGVLSLYKELLRLRREDAAFQKRDRDSMVAEALGPALLGLASWAGGERRLLIANFGGAARIDVAGQSWLARHWSCISASPWMLTVEAWDNWSKIWRRSWPARTPFLYPL